MMPENNLKNLNNKQLISLLDKLKSEDPTSLDLEKIKQKALILKLLKRYEESLSFVDLRIFREQEEYLKLQESNYYNKSFKYFYYNDKALIDKGIQLFLLEDVKKAIAYLKLAELAFISESSRIENWLLIYAIGIITKHSEVVDEAQKAILKRVNKNSIKFYFHLSKYLLNEFTEEVFLKKICENALFFKCQDKIEFYLGIKKFEKGLKKESEIHLKKVVEIKNIDDQEYFIAQNLLETL
jgi:hypothetical protein